MFNQDKFAEILNKINSTYNSMTEFAEKASFDRTYISKYINKKLKNPPSPKILEKLANASNGVTTYYELMSICDYIRTHDLFSDEIHPSLVNAFKETFVEYGISSEDVDAIEKLSKSSDNDKDKKISYILSKYSDSVMEEVFCTLEVNRQNLSNEIEFFRPIKKYINSLKLNYLENKQAFPLLGKVKAGYNYLATENIIGYVNIDKKISDPENYFALTVTGDSMQPILYEGDIIIVHRQNDIENGQVGIILIDNEEATVKKVIKHDDYIELIAFNSYYPPKRLDKNSKFQIIGKVTEARISKIFE